MNLFTLASKNLAYRWKRHVVNLLLFSVSIALLWSLTEFQKQSEAKLEKNLAHTDLVLGAKGSPLQIILSSLYHIDAPTGNIPLRHAERWMKHPMVSEAIPLSYGDYYQHYRILGSKPEILTWYSLELAGGEIWKNSGEVVLGAQVAAETGLRPGDTFQGQHGDKDAESGHGSYQVSGILGPTGSVMDQLILCSLETVWDVHQHDHQEEEEKEITAVLIRYKNAMAALQLPRMINENSSMQAAAPSIEINRLAFMLNNGTSSIKFAAYALLFLAVLSMLIQISSSLAERKKELALLRQAGFPPLKLIALLALEFTVLSVMAFLLGETGGRLFLHFFSEGLAYGSAYTFDSLVYGKEDLLWLSIPLLSSLFVILLHLRKIYSFSVADLLQND
ncbi:MAG: ABC transporter permease [Bacteroidota bacterium]|nr:ABC transporter permease [Bacteroidota bacterium]MDX5431325.1 ABC transporter permease [Bacteroidota bacterium]MDX5470063.1 ABC transporter permease [Bacteroidota bacterium]